MEYSEGSTGKLYDIFLDELQSRIKPLPIKSSNGNNCICIDMQNCSTDFLTCADEFIEKNAKHFKLHTKGETCYVEIISKKGMTSLFSGSDFL